MGTSGETQKEIRSFYSNAGDRAEQKVVANFNRRASAADVPDDTTEPVTFKKSQDELTLEGHGCGYT